MAEKPTIIFEKEVLNMIQSVIFDKKVWNKDEAKNWLKKHNMKNSVDEKPNTFRFRQKRNFRNKKYSTIDLIKGVKAVIYF